MRVLLVEDEERIASFMARALRRGNHRVEVLGEGLPAVRALSGPDSPHEVVILDLGLPDIDGLDVLRQVRQHGLEIPVIVVTARSSDEDQRRAIALGLADFLVKPFPLTRLLDALDQVASSADGHR